MQLQIDSFALKSDQLEGISEIFKTLIEGVLPQDRKQSMAITYMEEGSLVERKDCPEQQKQKQHIIDKTICIDPLCFCPSRQITEQDDHKGHTTCNLLSFLLDLKMLKCNSIYKTYSEEKVKQVLLSLDKVYMQIQDLQLQICALLRSIKIKTYNHIKEVKQSFNEEYYQSFKKKLLANFDYATVMLATGQIEKFRMLKYDNLEYPLFKTSIIEGRIKENSKIKDKCLQYLQSWSNYTMGQHTNYNKVFNRSTDTFMFKSTSQKRMFSYYLRSSDYFVFDLGKKLKRIAFSDKIPLAVIEKRLGKDKVLIRVNKMSKKGIVIGCGILKEMQRCHFNNCYKKGFFVYSNGLVFSQQTQEKNIFKFGQGDIISIHKEDYRIYFHKIQNGNVADGFYVNLKPFDEEGTLSVNQKYYPAALIGDSDGELQVLQ